MLQGLFNYDNPVWRFIGKLGDLILLNILWTICSIPVFTIGATTTALYYVTMKLVRDEDDGVIKGFFHSFRQNFKQATAIWLILLAAGVLLGFDFWFFLTGQMKLQGAVQTVLVAVFGGLVLILLFVLTYVFAIQARFFNPVKRTLFNAFFMSVRHLVQTIGIIATDVIIVAASYFSLYYLPQISVLLFLFGLPLIAFVNSYFFTAIFQRYIPKEEGGERRDSGVSPLLDEDNPEIEDAIQSLKGK